MAALCDPVRRRLLLGGAALCSASMLSRQASGADLARPIEIGIRPYQPTAALMAGHQALRQHFEKAFQRRVALSTAPDFVTFQQRVLRGDFDFVVIGPGPGWQAHLDRGYPIVAMARRKLRIYILVARDSPITRIPDLRGKLLASINPYNLSAQVVRTILREHGLQPDSDVRIVARRNSFEAAQLVALGDADAMVIPNMSFSSLPPEFRNQLRVLHDEGEFPGILFLVCPGADLPDAADFQAALLAFANDTEAGRAYIREAGLDGLVVPDPKALRVLDRFVPEIRRVMLAN